jgi:hypothetical protein
MHYAFFLERQLFLFLVFFFFVCCNKWLDHIMLFWREMNSVFHLPRTLCFSLLSFNECSLFLLLHLALIFRLDFCSDLALYLHQGVFGPLVHVGFYQKSCLKKFEWCWKREKVLCKKVIQKGACVDCGLGFCMSCLMSF